MAGQTNWYVKNFNISTTFKKISNKQVIRSFLIFKNQSENDVCLFFSKSTTEDKDFDNFIEEGTTLAASNKTNYYILRKGESITIDNNLPANSIYSINLSATTNSSILIIDNTN